MIKKSNLMLYWQGYLSKTPFSIIGLVFICMALFIAIPLILILGSILKEPYEKYIYNKIISEGINKKAIIKNIDIKTNVKFNGINPRVITYEYNVDNSIHIDKFQTVDIDKLDSLRNNDSITVSVLHNQSVIKDIKPYTFPLSILGMIPAIFLILGIPLFCIGHFAGMHYINRKVGYNSD